MAKKYRKLGLRRDNNLADIENKYSALSNVLNGLAEPGETFFPEDLSAINNLRNTNVTGDDFAQIKGLKLTYLDSENTEQTLTPIVRLEDRVENYKVVTGSPPYLTGGDGLNAKFIPSSTISTNITTATTGSTIFNDAGGEPNYGPFLFWDNGSFEFQNLIYPDFQNSYGMVQWEGYFAPAPGDQTLTINYATSGLLLIEQDPFDNNTWETLKFIYNKDRAITVVAAAAQTQITTIAVGENIKYLSIGDKLTNQEIYITNVSVANGTITLDTPIDLVQGNNVLNFEFVVGDKEIQGFFNLRSTFLNDKIKIRITIWWPDPQDATVFYGKKTLSMYYPNSVVNFGRDILSYNFLYSNFSRQYETETLSVEYFLNNYLSPTNEKTNYDISVNSNILLKYSPPTLPANRFDSTAMRTFTYTGLGKIERSNSFSATAPGDFIIRTTTYTKTYLIKEKVSNAAIFINSNNDIVPNIGNTFDGFVIKNSGLVGVFNVNNLTLSALTDNDYHISLVKENQLLAIIGTNNVITGFFKIVTYNFETGALTLATVLNTGETPPTTGIAVVYRSAALEDLSKVNFCKGVLGKEVNAIAAATSNKIYLKDTTGLSVDMYVQLEGYIPSTTQIASISSDIGGSFITLKSGTVQAQIDKDITLTFSPDSVNRELCVIPLNTAPPFAGTDTGLITQAGSEALDVSKVRANKLTLKQTTAQSTTDRSFAKSLQFLANGVSYNFLIK